MQLIKKSIICLMLILISISPIISEPTKEEKILKRLLVKHIKRKISFSNELVDMTEQYKDERLKYRAATNINRVERQKTKIWKDQSSNSWLYTVRDIAIIWFAIEIIIEVKKFIEK